MRLDEILNKALPFNIDDNSEGVFAASFKAGKREIKFFAQNEGAQDGYDEGVWDIVFGEKIIDDAGLEKLSYEKTGGGKEFAVFATLKAILEKFIKACNPEIIEFSAEKTDGANRANAYARMFKKNLPKGWSLQRDDGPAHSPVYFMMVKEDVRDDWLSLDTIKQIWNDANEKVFDGQLDMPKLSLEDDLNYLAKRYGPDAMEEAKNGDMLGYCDKEGSKIILRFSKKIKNARELLEVVVHEMVHQAEAMRLTWLKMLRDPHGEEFLAWEDRVKKYHNLSLRQIIGQ